MKSVDTILRLMDSSRDVVVRCGNVRDVRSSQTLATKTYQNSLSNSSNQRMQMKLNEFNTQSSVFQVLPSCHPSGGRENAAICDSGEPLWEVSDSGSGEWLSQPCIVPALSALTMSFVTLLFETHIQPGTADAIGTVSCLEFWIGALWQPDVWRMGRIGPNGLIFGDTQSSKIHYSCQGCLLSWAMSF